VVLYNGRKFDCARVQTPGPKIFFEKDLTFWETSAILYTEREKKGEKK